AYLRAGPRCLPADGPVVPSQLLAHHGLHQPGRDRGSHPVRDVARPQGRSRSESDLTRNEVLNMIPFAAGLLLVPLVDQSLTVGLRRRLGAGSVPLGPLGTLRLVRAQIWLARPTGRPRLGAIWTLWLAAAGALTILSVLAPSCGWCAGLLLGGS